MQIRSAKLRLALLAAGLFGLVLAGAFATFSLFNFPNYGAWTGIQPLETKLSMLKEFANEGDVDALVIGSSIVDFGFDAKLFSELMSAERGKPYRAFNFSTGGAQLRTLPSLYRIARTVSKPKSILVVAPVEKKVAEELTKQGPDFTLQNAPVGEVLAHPFLLSLARFFRDTPLLRNAPAVRDLVMYGDFRSLQSKIGMEAYSVSDHGDRISYLMTWHAKDLPMWQKRFQYSVLPFPTTAATGDELLKKKAEFYFAQRDIEGLRELRKLADDDGIPIVIFAHAAASTLANGIGDSAEYRQIRRDFVEAMASVAGAKRFDPVTTLAVQLHEVADSTHLNTYGAAAYTRASFAALTGKTGYTVDDPIKAPPEGLLPTTDKTFVPNSALVRRPPNEAHPLLHFRMVTTRAVPPIPPGDLTVALRTPDNVDIIAVAAELGPSDYVAEVNLPASDRPEGYVLRLLTGPRDALAAMPNTVADYEWINAFPKLGTRVRGPEPPVRAYALPPARNAGENLYIALKSDKPLPASLDLRLAATGASANDGIALGKVNPGRELIKVAIPASVEDGDYAVHVRDAAGAHLATSQPIRISARETPINVLLEGQPYAGEGKIAVGWSGIRRPTPQDWLGLFPVGTGDEGRLTFQFTSGKRAGSMSLVVPASIRMDQDFEVRLYAQGVWKLLGKSAPFRFQAGSSPATEAAAASAAAATIAAAKPPASNARVTIDPSSAIADGVVRVNWTGIEKPTAQDWIGLFPVSGNDASRVAFLFLPGTSEGQVSFNLPQGYPEKIATGDYEMRLYAAGGWNVMARSGKIIAGAPAGPGR